MSNSNVVNTFIELVQIDSPSGSESAFATYIQKQLQDLGITSDIDAAGNLFARISGTGNPVLLNAHLDTVEPGRGIKPQVRDGFIYSDGSTILGADNKAAVAAILSALKSTPKKSLRSLELIFSVREETDSGISEFDFSQLQCKSGLIADHAAKIGSIVLSSPWIMNLQIKIIGKPAHSSLPETAINALSVAASAISQTTWGRVDPQTTSNIGLISGGTAMNSIPGSVTLIGEIRSFSKIELENYLADTKSKFANICQKLNAKCQFDSQWYCPGYVYKESDLAVSQIAKIMSRLGVLPFYETAFGASDANVFSDKNIQVVSVGDGCNHPHTTEESISLADLELLEKLINAYIIKADE